MLLTTKQFRPALALIICSIVASRCALASPMERSLFGFFQQANKNSASFPQMTEVSSRYLVEHHKLKRCAIKQDARCETNDWFSMLQQWQEYSGHDLLTRLNTAINQFHYRADRHNYAREDYWATPLELMENGGDCEDFAIAKMLALQHLGVPSRSMRVVVVQDTAAGQAHAVLAVTRGEETVILDNKTNSLLSDKSLPHYTPLYSINKHQWWLHMPAEVAERRFVQAASTTGSEQQTSGSVVSR